jgi:hypothetical protein
MMVQVPINQCAAIAIYLLAIIGISLSVATLSSLVAKQAIVIALPYLDNGPPKLSLIEQRRIDTARAAQPLPQRARIRVTALETLTMPAAVLAARLDLAEKIDPASTPAPTHVASAGSANWPKLRTVRSNSTYAAVSVRDVFNRSFGVLSVAAN